MHTENGKNCNLQNITTNKCFDRYIHCGFGELQFHKLQSGLRHKFQDYIYLNYLHLRIYVMFMQICKQYKLETIRKKVIEF